MTEAKEEPEESLSRNQHEMDSVNVSGSSLYKHENV